MHPLINKADDSWLLVEKLNCGDPFTSCIKESSCFYAIMGLKISRSPWVGAVPDFRWGPVTILISAGLPTSLIKLYNIRILLQVQ